MKTKFAHVRGKRPHTVAYRVTPNGDIEYAVAYCHPKDQYCKATGRVKAEGRLNSSRYRKVWQGMLIKDFLTEVYS